MEKVGQPEQQRPWVQWKYKAAEAPGDAIPVGEITIKILDAVRALYAKEGGKCPDPILNLK
jgi:formate dehydrogenase major subunit